MAHSHSDVFPPPFDVQATAYVRHLDAYRQEYEEARRDPTAFWLRIAQRIAWIRPPREAFRGDFTADASVEWFPDGVLNATASCLDRHLMAGRGDAVALIWEGNEPGERRRFTYRELHNSVMRAANALAALGVRRGDRVAIYLQMIPELPIAMLACAHLGAVHSVVFGGFSAESLAVRMRDAGCVALITQDTGIRGAKRDIAMKASADRAAARVPTLRHVLVVRRTGMDVPMHDGRDVWWHEALEQAQEYRAAEPMRAEDPLFTLYTSGSTGIPKGLLHTTGGYLVYASYTHERVFDYRPGQVYWCTADMGWITGHSYTVYGPLANGATVVMFEGVPNYPDHGRYWRIVEELGVQVFYTAPTALRALMKEGDRWPRAHNRTSLRILGTVGEPIKPPEWHWYRDVIGEGRCPIVDTWWQTETGGVCIAPLPGATPTKPGSATLPLPGIQPVILDDDGRVLEGPAAGNLAIAAPWPGLARTIYGDHARFRATYFTQFPGFYITGDGCRRDEDGYYWITGRVDDIIIVSGHNLGTAEIEGAIGAHPAVAEAAVVGVPHDVKGNAVYAFVTLKTGEQPSDAIRDAIVAGVRAAIGAHAVPEYIQFAPGLPKTRSGKIMRRVLKCVATGATSDLGDTSTLADPSVVEALVAGRVP